MGKDFWASQIRWRKNGDRVIAPGDRFHGCRVIRAGGHHFILGPEDEPGMRGFGGARWRFRLLATGKVIESTNVWAQGEIPARFRDQLPDNVKIV